MTTNFYVTAPVNFGATQSSARQATMAQALRRADFLIGNGAAWVRIADRDGRVVASERLEFPVRLQVK